MSAHATTQPINAKSAWGGGTSPFGISYGKMMMWFFLMSDAFTFSGLLTAYGFMRHKWHDVWPVAGEVFVHFPFYEGHIQLLYVAFMTFVLIASSVTMVLAVEAGHRMAKKGVIIWMFLTIVGGAIFVGSQAWEWYHFIHGTPHGSYASEHGTGPSYFVIDSKGEKIKDLDKGVGIRPIVEKEGEVSKLITGEEAKKIIEGSNWVQGANLTHNEYGHALFADFFFFITGFHGFHVFSGVVINIIIFFGVINGTYHKRGHYEMVEKTGLYWHFVDLVWVFVFTFFYLL